MTAESMNRLPPEIYDDIIANVHGAITLKHLALTSFTTRAAVLPRLFQRLSISLGDTDAIERLARQLSPYALASVHTLGLAIRIEDEGITEHDIELTMHYLGYIIHRLLSLKAVEVNLVVKADSFDQKNIAAFSKSELFQVYDAVVLALSDINTLASTSITLWDTNSDRSLVTGSAIWQQMFRWPDIQEPEISLSHYTHDDNFPASSLERQVCPTRGPLTLCSFVRSHNLRHVPAMQEFGTIRRLCLEIEDLKKAGTACLTATKNSLEVLILKGYALGPIHLDRASIDLPNLIHLGIKHAVAPFSLDLLYMLQCPRLKGFNLSLSAGKGFGHDMPNVLYSSLSALFRKSKSLVGMWFRFGISLSAWRQVAPVLERAKAVLMPSGCRLDLEIDSTRWGEAFTPVDLFSRATPSSLYNCMIALAFRTHDFMKAFDCTALPTTYPRVATCTFSIAEDQTPTADPHWLGRIIKDLLLLHHMPHLERFRLDIRSADYDSALSAILASLDDYPDLHEIQVDVYPPGGTGFPIACPPTFVEQCAQKGVRAGNKDVIHPHSLALRERVRVVQKRRA